MGLISKSENGWELFRISDKSLSCENSKLNEDDIDHIEKILKPEFGDRMKKETVFVSYDNWSGVFIMSMAKSKTKDSDELIKEIFEFLSVK